MRESGFWSRGTSSFQENSRPIESRARYEENDRSSYRSSPRSDNSYRNSSYNNNSRPNQNDRDNRYGNNPGGMCSPPPSDHMGPPRGPMMGGGPPQMGNGPPMGPPQGNPGMGPMGGPGGDPDLYSSIQTLSHMSAQQNDIASKIISAVLSTNIMGNMGNQQGPPQFPRGEMGGGGGDFTENEPFPPPGASSMRDGGSRMYGPSGGGFDSFYRERRGRSPRGSFSGSGGGYKPSYERHTDSRSTSSDLRGRLAPKRSWSDTHSRDEHSNFKRRRGGSRDRSGYSGRKERESRPHDKRNTNRSKSVEENDKEDKGKEPKEEIPVAAMYCHMCKQGNFSSEKTYLFHLEGIRHSKVAAAFHAKNESMLEYLCKNAKLASIGSGGMDPSVTPTRCSICTALVMEKIYKHMKLLEHRVVKKFLKPKCCSRFFKTRHDMDEHRLSLPHLMKIHKENEEKKLLQDDTIKEGTTLWTFEDAVKHLKSKNPSEEDVEDLNWKNIPAFDGNSFIGIDMLESTDAVMCVPCGVLLRIGFKSLENHMASIDHYNTVVDYLREKKRKTPIEVGETPEKFNRGEEKEESEDDDDAVGVEVKNSEDEGEDDNKEDLPYINESDHIVLEEVGVDMEDTNDVKEEEDDDDAGVDQEVQEDLDGMGQMEEEVQQEYECEDGN